MTSILIAEDDNDWAEKILSNLGAQNPAWLLHRVYDGLEAMEFLDANPVDLLITDLRMPRKDGFHLVAHLTANSPHVPVIVLTGLEEPDLAQHLPMMEAIQVLRKPDDLHLIGDCVRTALSQVQTGYIQGVTLPSFLQLLNWEHKNGTIKIHSMDLLGTLYLVHGEVIHAVCGDLTGREALRAILLWKNPQIEFQDVCTLNQRTISDPLGALLVELATQLDESSTRPASVALQPASDQRPESTPVLLSADEPAASLDGILEHALRVDGVVAAAVGNCFTGQCMASRGLAESVDLPVMVQHYAAWMRSNHSLQLRWGSRNGITEASVTTGSDHHLLLRPALGCQSFLFVVLRRGTTHAPHAQQLLLRIAAPLAGISASSGTLASEAMAAVQSGDSSHASLLLEQLTESEPANVWAWSTLAQIARTASDKVRCLRRALELEPGDRAASSALSSALLDWGLLLLQTDVPAARKILAEVCQRDQTHAQAWRLLAKAMDSPDKAGLCLQQALRLESRQRPSVPAPSALDPELAPILVVDDSPTVRKQISKLLERNGYPTLLAGNGIEALSVLHDHKPALVFLDINMPLMDGFHLCKALKTNELTHSIPIVMVSGYSSAGDRQKGLSFGASEYIIKPFEPVSVLQAARRFYVSAGAAARAAAS